jgi:hypothetical protein
MSLDLDDIKEIVKSHMENQPYRITCSECGKDLEHDSTIDLIFDLELVVTPCDCVTPDAV